MIIISGEKIQDMCDYFLGTESNFAYNPHIICQKDKQILLSSLTVPVTIKSKLSIFIYTCLLEDNNHKTNVKRLLSLFKTNLTLFFHNSDGAFTINDMDLFLIPNVVEIYSQNITCPIVDNLKPLPIGQANNQWVHGNAEQLLNVINCDVSKTNDIFLNFKINTNITKRLLCYNIIIGKNIPNIPNHNYKDYLNLLHTYKFAICPEGNGIDTHRFWECLYLKVIPICLKNPITEYYGKLFPIVLLDSWDELNIENLKYVDNWENYNMLSMENIF